MSIRVNCKNLSGELDIPCSKSLAHRYLIASFLSGNNKEISNFLAESDDIIATRECLLSLAANNSSKLYCKESGTTLRLLMAVCLALGKEACLIASGSLVNRPMNEFIKELENHGANIGIVKSDNEIIYELNGQIKPGNYSIAGNISSQFISGLLLALPLLDGDSELEIIGELESKPYVDLTLQTLKDFGVNIKSNENRFMVQGNQKYQYTESCKKILEADWSIAAMWLVANKIIGEKIKLKGLNCDSLQADRFITSIIDIDDDLDIEVSVKDCPDLIAAIALLALYRKGTTKIVDAERLKIKESNRMKTTADILSSIGADVKLQNDGITITGGKLLTGSDEVIDTKGDHRMVMLASLASIMTYKSVVIDNPESVNKSYPNFFDDVSKLGGHIEWN